MVEPLRGVGGRTPSTTKKNLNIHLTVVLKFHFIPFPSIKKMYPDLSFLPSTKIRVLNGTNNLEEANWLDYRDTHFFHEIFFKMLPSCIVHFETWKSLKKLALFLKKRSFWCSGKTFRKKTFGKHSRILPYLIDTFRTCKIFPLFIKSV